MPRDRWRARFSIVVAQFVVRLFVGSMRPWKSLTLSSVIVRGRGVGDVRVGAVTSTAPTAADPAMTAVILRRNFDLIVFDSLVDGRLTADHSHAATHPEAV